MGDSLPATDSRSWGDPGLEIFPLDRKLADLPAGGMWGMFVWKLFEHLGPMADAIEAELLDCLAHPEGFVRDAVEKALGGATSISANGYRRFLGYADEQGCNGFMWTRAVALARHTDIERLGLITAACAPSQPSASLEVRMAILESLSGEAAAAAHAFLAGVLSLPWREDDHYSVLAAFSALCRQHPAGSQDADSIRALVASPDASRRCGAAAWLGEHGGEQDKQLLLQLVSDPSPRVRASVCRGLSQCQEVSTDVLRAVAGTCLGNYDGFDEQPHADVVQLILGSPGHPAAVIDEIERWWTEASRRECVERNEAETAMDLCDRLEASLSRRLLPGLRRVLHQWERPAPAEEWPALDSPGAVDEIRARMEQSMIEQGNDPELAKSCADLNALVLDAFAQNLDQYQAEIDADWTAFEAERREIYPELFEADEGTTPGSDPGDEVEYVDEFVLRLRATVARLDTAQDTA